MKGRKDVKNHDIIRLLNEDLSEDKIAQKLHCSRSLVWHRKRKLGLSKR